MGGLKLKTLYMGFNFRTRINLGKGLGLNISKSGISPSLRTRAGSISPKGFSVKTGIPGASYRNNFSKSNAGGCTKILLLGILIMTLTTMFF